MTMSASSYSCLSTKEKASKHGIKKQVVLSALPSADLHHLCAGKRGRQVQWRLLEQWQLLWQVRFFQLLFPISLPAIGGSYYGR